MTGRSAGIRIKGDMSNRKGRVVRKNFTATLPGVTGYIPGLPGYVVIRNYWKITVPV